MKRDTKVPAEVSSRWQRVLEGEGGRARLGVLLEPLPTAECRLLNELSALMLGDAVERLLLIRRGNAAGASFDARNGATPLDPAAAEVVSVAACLPPLQQTVEATREAAVGAARETVKLLSEHGLVTVKAIEWAYCPSCDGPVYRSASDGMCFRCRSTVEQRFTNYLRLSLEHVEESLRPALEAHFKGRMDRIFANTEEGRDRLFRQGLFISDSRGKVEVPPELPSQDPIAALSETFIEACQTLELCRGPVPRPYFVSGDAKLEVFMLCLASVLQGIGKELPSPPFAKTLLPTLLGVEVMLCPEHGNVAVVDDPDENPPSTCPQCGKELKTRLFYGGDIERLNVHAILRDLGADVVRLLFLGTQSFRQREILVLHSVVIQEAQRQLAALGRHGSRIVNRLGERDEPTGEALSAEELELQQHIHATILDAERSVIPTLDFVRASYIAFNLVKLTAKKTGSCRAPLLRQALETALIILHPVLPITTEELWAELGHAESILAASWPVGDPELAISPTIEIPVQIGKRVRARLEVPREIKADALEALVLADAEVREAIGERMVRRVRVVQKRLVNLELAPEQDDD